MDHHWAPQLGAQLAYGSVFHSYSLCFLLFYLTKNQIVDITAWKSAYRALVDACRHRGFREWDGCGMTRKWTGPDVYELRF